ncbi:MAG: DUF502 domain-containing protein [Verrucomicrobiota bacterium]|nr:DUF502 domain-containing protein [Verrucomicrobiota bacterium]
MSKSLFARWRASFLAGLAVTLPAIVSIAAFLWVFRTVSNLTDLLLFFLPHHITHEGGGAGPIRWYWSAVALLLAVILVSAVGLLARYYIGKQMIKWADHIMMRVPLLNKFYGAIKQVNEAFSGNKNSFKTVVLVEFPREGIYSVGFITSEQHDEVRRKTNEKVVCVFVPTTPNPTSGFLVLVPEKKVVKLDMSVGDGLKYIVSLGSISPEQKFPPPLPPPLSPPANV